MRLLITLLFCCVCLYSQDIKEFDFEQKATLVRDSSKVVSEDILIQLAQDKDETIRWMVAQHSCCTDSVSQILYNDKDVFVIVALAMNKKVSSEILSKIAVDLNKWDDVEARWIRISLVGNPNISQETFLKLSLNHVKEFNVDVRYDLAIHPYTSVELLSQLAEYPDLDAGYAILKRKNVTLDITKIIAKKGAFGVRCYLARKTQNSLEVWRILVKDKDPDVRQDLAKNENIPDEIKHKLLQDSSPWVKYGLTENKKINKEVRISILKELSKNSDTLSRSCAASHPETPKDTLIKLSQDVSDSVKSCVIDNPSISIDLVKKLLTELSESKDHLIRAYVAGHRETPINIRCKLLVDKSYYVSTSASKAFRRIEKESKK